MIDPTQQADVEAAAITHMDGYGTIAECAAEYGVSASDVRWCVVHLKSSADARRRARKHRAKHNKAKEDYIDPHQWQAINTLAKSLDLSVDTIKNGLGKTRWSHLERREVAPGEVKHGNQKYMVRLAPGSPARPLDIGESWPPVSATSLEPESLRDGDAVDRDLIAGLHQRAELLEAERDEARAELDLERSKRRNAIDANLRMVIDEARIAAERADEAAAAAAFEIEGLNLVIADAHAEIKALEARLALASDAPRAVEPDRAARIALGVGAGIGLIGAALLRRMARGTR